MSPLPPDLKEELQQEYAQSFDGKLTELNKAYASQNSDELKNIFHKLAGSGKTYEMEAITDLARSAEDSLIAGFNPQQVEGFIKKMSEIFAQEKQKLKK